MKQQYSRRAAIAGTAAVLAGCSAPDEGEEETNKSEDGSIGGNVALKIKGATDQVKAATVRHILGIGKPSRSEFAFVFTHRHPRTLEIILYNDEALTGSRTVKTDGREWSESYTSDETPEMTGFNRAVIHVSKGHG